MRLERLVQRLMATPAWALLALAAILRLTYALKLGSRFYQIDELGFDGAAWNLATYGVIGQGLKPGVAPPVPAAFFGLIYSLMGHDMLYPRLAQGLLGTATAWCLGRMTEELTNSAKAGRLALALSCVYPFFIYYGGVLLSETLYVFFLVPGLWWLCRSLGEKGSPSWRPAAAGLCLALAGLCRIEGVPIATLIWATGAASCLAGRWNWRSLGLAVLCWTLPLLGWAERNRIQTGAAKLDNHGSITLLFGTMFYDLDQKLGTGDAMKVLEKESFYIEAQRLSPAERDRLYYRVSLNYMRDHPGTTLVQWARKFVSFWRFYPRLDSTYYDSVYSKPGVGLQRGALVAISLLFEPWLIMGGLAGLWTLRTRWVEIFPLLVFILGTMGIHVLVVSMMRYRLPIMPILILGACHLAALKTPQSLKR